jgi:hypothetical protein
VIAVIGPQWHTILTQHDPENDTLRYELKRAHELEIPVIPVLSRNASIDQEQELYDLKWIRELQFFTLIDEQGRWETDLEKLVECIENSTHLKPVKQSDLQLADAKVQSSRQQTSHGAQSPNIQIGKVVRDVVNRFGDTINLYHLMWTVIVGIAACNAFMQPSLITKKNQLISP